MKVLYDGYIFSAQHAGGISRYLANLLQRLPHDWSPVLRLDNGAKAPDSADSRVKVERLPPTDRRPQALMRHLAEKKADLLDRTGRYDLLHPTYYFRLPERFVTKGRRPIVATVFDLILEHYAEQLDPTGLERRAKKSMIESADAILCISENTKRELQEHYRIPDDRVTVTYLAAGLDKAMVSSSYEPPGRPYVLFLGNRGIYKNFARTVLAFAQIKEEWRDLRLCVVGAPFNMQEVELIHALEINGRVNQVAWTSDSDLAGLYHSSEALLYPSLDEGFGIPPLEAMACGTVVISSNASSLPEVVGDAAIDVNPNSISEIAEALLSLRDLGGKRDELIQRGLKQVGKFDWDITVRQTIELYKSVV